LKLHNDSQIDSQSHSHIAKVSRMNDPISNALSAFPLLRLHFSFQALDTLRLEGFTGSTWHGALGHALARLSPETFELLYGLPGQDSGTPRPFVLLPDQALGDTAPGLGFSITLFGPAVECVSVLVLAAENLAAAGLGNRQIPLRLLRVMQTHAVAGGSVTSEVLGLDGFWRGGLLAPLSLADLATPWQQVSARTIVLHFDTRLRLKASSGVLKQPPTLDVLMKRLLERISALALLYGTDPLPSDGVRALLAQARSVVLAHSTLRWAEWSRASGRTGQIMPWGGLIGEVSYRGDLTELLPWLGLGEWLHVGSKTSFGLGHYRLLSAPV
jgi:hypothetical protein